MCLNSNDIKALHILIGSASQEDLRIIAEIYNDRNRLLREQKAVQEKARFYRGQKVTFRGKYGETIQGVIERMNAKTIGVLAENGVHWRVSPSLLNAAA